MEIGNLKRRKCDWVGLVIKNRYRIATGLGSIEPGAYGVILRNNRGLHVEFVPCLKCGTTFSVSKLSPRSVEVVDRIAVCSPESGDYMIYRGDAIPLLKTWITTAEMSNPLSE